METVETTFSSDTSVEWIPEAFSRRRFIFWRQTWGTYFATHKAFPGLHGTGDTAEAACDDLIAAIHSLRHLYPHVGVADIPEGEQ